MRETRAERRDRCVAALILLGYGPASALTALWNAVERAGRQRSARGAPTDPWAVECIDSREPSVWAVWNDEEERARPEMARWPRGYVFRGTEAQARAVAVALASPRATAPARNPMGEMPDGLTEADLIGGEF